MGVVWWGFSRRGLTGVLWGWFGGGFVGVF